MKRIVTIAAALLASIPLLAQVQATDPYVFAFFKEPGTQGIYLALSRDGYTYTPLNDGQPWVIPQQPGEIMRDVYITREPHAQGFRMVWTWSWHGDAIGTSESTDLITWSPQRKLPVMSAFPRVRNTWAPETYWDPARKQWLILYSSSFVPLDAQHPQPQDGLRIWATRTRDWQTFSPPSIFLNSSFPAIDATMFHRTLHHRHDIVLVVKNQSSDPLRYDEVWTSGPSLDGPWGAISAPINESWSEGPSVVQIGPQSVVFYDHYRPPHAQYQAVETSDWVHWTSANAKIHLPDGAKHGSFFRVTPAEAQRLLSRHDPPATTPQPSATSATNATKAAN